MQGQDTAGVVYHGYRRHPFQRVIAVESADGELMRMLPHMPGHSPSGMNWGYTGAGPRDTARSLLIDVLGPDAICPACNGTGRVTYVTDGDGYRAEPFDSARHPRLGRGWPCQCAGGYKHLPYSAFADQFVGRWADEWVISKAAILSWLAQQADTGAASG